MTRAAITAALVMLGACSGRAPVAACTDDLAGAWRTETGQRWMIIDGGKALEAYTLFDDTHPPGGPTGVELGPRVIDLARTAQGADGDVKRRYLRAGDECLGRAPAHLISCAGDTLELVLADPTPPAAFSPCAWGRTEASRRERWHRASQ